MIIMINGAFGVGKTSVALELLNTMDNAMLFDPGEVGFMIRHISTDELSIDKIIKVILEKIGLILPEEVTGKA